MTSKRLAQPAIRLNEFDCHVVHVVADTRNKLSAACTMLERRCTVTSELLGTANIRGKNIDAIVVAADLRVVENISAVKAVSGKLTSAPKRVFLIDQRTRLAIVQAYALGATHVLTNPVNQPQLLATLANRTTSSSAPSETSPRGGERPLQVSPVSHRCFLPS